MFAAVQNFGTSLVAEETFLDLLIVQLVARFLRLSLSAPALYPYALLARRTVRIVAFFFAGVLPALKHFTANLSAGGDRVQARFSILEPSNLILPTGTELWKSGLSSTFFARPCMAAFQGAFMVAAL